MKKILLVMLALMVLFAMTACGDPYEIGALTELETDTMSGAFMEINEGSVTPTSVEPIVIIADDFELKTTGGLIFSLEQSQDDGWHTLVPKAEVEVSAQELTFKRGKTTLSYKWGDIYGELPDGFYRVIGNFVSDDGEPVYLSAEFEIGESQAPEEAEDNEEIVVPDDEEIDDSETPDADAETEAEG